jgi:hypothetical protein
MVGLVMGDRRIVGVRRRGAWGSTYLDVFWACACGDVIGGQFILVIATGEGIVEELFVGRGKQFIGDMWLLSVDSEGSEVGE